MLDGIWTIVMLIVLVYYVYMVVAIIYLCQDLFT
jgi:hypothetical protein